VSGLHGTLIGSGRTAASLGHEANPKYKANQQKHKIRLTVRGSKAIEVRERRLRNDRGGLVGVRTFRARGIHGGDDVIISAAGGDSRI
jgi:hypothetical protein